MKFIICLLLLNVAYAQSVLKIKTAKVKNQTLYQFEHCEESCRILGKQFYTYKELKSEKNKQWWQAAFAGGADVGILVSTVVLGLGTGSQCSRLFKKDHSQILMGFGTLGAVVGSLTLFDLYEPLNFKKQLREAMKLQNLEAKEVVIDNPNQFIAELEGVLLRIES
jgi:hypothetical protein